MGVKVIRRFPDISRPGFEFRKWNEKFHNNNVILNGKYSNIYYPDHWTPLSIKCAFGGTEYYRKGSIKYAVDDKVFLILNEGTVYESYIDSDKKVESFTINFCTPFANEIYSVLDSEEKKLLDSPENGKSLPKLHERLFLQEWRTISILNRLRLLINENYIDENYINEALHGLLEQIIFLSLANLKKAENLLSVKNSTRLELLKRLGLAKDFMYSCYNEKIDIKHLSEIACLSPHHFLRSFKQVYKLTPHRFLTNRRIEAAKELLESSDMTVGEICQNAGFESTSSFGALFKKIQGIPPEKFRQAIQKKQFSNIR